MSEPNVKLNPSWVIQSAIAVLLALIGYMGNVQMELIKTQYNSIQVDVKQLRADFTALEIGLRGNRFTDQDWKVERNRLDKQLDEIRNDIRNLQKLH